VNPALSMPRDWDLFALLGPPLLLFFAALLLHSDDTIPAAPLHGTTLAFGVFTIAAVALNAWAGAVSVRLERVGEHVFRTYHSGSSYILNVAQMMEPDTARAIARRIGTLRRLEPSVVGEDLEYAHLVTRVGDLYLGHNEVGEATKWRERAVAIAPHHDDLLLWLADCYLRLGRSEEAQREIDLVMKRNPRNSEALIIAAMAAVRQHRLDDAVTYLERAHAVKPGDGEVEALLARVRAQAARAAQASIAPASRD
jgi:predicted Zn-dependent protease